MHKVLQKVGDKHICTAAIILKDGRILNGHRHYVLENKTTLSVWTCPGGRCEKGETIEQTLRREIEEETGISEISIKSFIGSVPGANGDDQLYIFYATTDQDPILMEPEKFSEWKWITLKEYISIDPKTRFNRDASELIVSFLDTL